MQALADDSMESMYAAMEAAIRGAREEIIRNPAPMETPEQRDARRAKCQELAARRELLWEAARHPRGRISELTTLPSYHFPQIVFRISPDGTKLLSRDAAMHLTTERVYSVTNDELRTARARIQPTWKPVKPHEDPDMACALFIDAYRAMCEQVFRVRLPASWNPLAPRFKNGRKNGTCTSFRKFLGYFVRNGLVFPHGWLYYRVNILLDYGNLLDRVKDGSIGTHLRHYTTFMHLLGGEAKASTPKSYQPFLRTRGGYYRCFKGRGALRTTAVGTQLDSLVLTSVDSLSQKHAISTVEEAEALLRATGFFAERDKLVEKSLREIAAEQRRLDSGLHTGRWIWRYPGERCALRKQVDAARKEAK